MSAAPDAQTLTAALDFYAGHCPDNVNLRVLATLLSSEIRAVGIVDFWSKVYAIELFAMEQALDFYKEHEPHALGGERLALVEATCEVVKARLALLSRRAA